MIRNHKCYSFYEYFNVVHKCCLLFLFLSYTFKVWFIYPEGTAVNQPAYPYASYSTQAGNPVTNLYPVGNYPTQYSSGTTPQPQYQYQTQPQTTSYQEPEKVPSAPPPSYDEAHQWFITHFYRNNDRHLNLIKCKEGSFFLFNHCFIYLNWLVLRVSVAQVFLINI